MNSRLYLDTMTESMRHDLAQFCYEQGYLDEYVFGHFFPDLDFTQQQQPIPDPQPAPVEVYPAPIRLFLLLLVGIGGISAWYLAWAALQMILAGI